MTFKCLTCNKNQKGKLNGKKTVVKNQIFGTCGKCTPKVIISCFLHSQLVQFFFFFFRSTKSPKVVATPIQKPKRTGRPKGLFQNHGKKHQGDLKKALLKEATRLAGGSAQTLIVETAKDLDDSIGLSTLAKSEGRAI